MTSVYDAMPNPPTTIGRYEVVQVLGRGGMGTVYLARDPRLERTLAIKVLSVEGDDDELQERFSREARSAGALRHPNIVTIYDLGVESGRPFIAMEYVNGESLSEMIKRRAQLPLERKLQLIEQLFRGLAYAHKLNIIHRDIKPANLMVNAEGDLKILDFGLARLAGAFDPQLTRSGVMMGTPNYMSPEQVEGRVLDQRSDIFSAGVVMFELLTYQKAFNAESPIAVLHKIVSAQMPSISEVIPGIDADLERIVATATQRDPDARYSRAELLVRDLQRIMGRLDTLPDRDGDSTVLTPDPRPTRAPVDGDRKRLRAARIETLLADAEMHLDAREFIDAAKDCENALLLDSENRRALELLDRARAAIDDGHVANLITEAQTELSNGNAAEANALLDRVLELRPAQTDVLEMKREAARQHVESTRRLEQQAAVQRAMDLAKANIAEGAFEAALRATGEALAHDPGNAAALALRQEVNDALVAPNKQAFPDHNERPLTAPELTIVAGQPSLSVAAPAAPYEGTVFMPAAAVVGTLSGRPRVRVTVLQSVDANVVNESFEIGETFEIGRHGRDLSAADPSWSRRHASIEYGDRGYVIRDLGSTGGTYVNGRRVRADVPEPLFFGARIGIGGSLLMFSAVSDIKLPDLTGVVVADRYLLERLLRTSSKGAIYSARQQTLPLRHALKLLSPALFDYPGYRERFRREAEVAIELHHPHICDVQDYGETTLIRPGKPPIRTAFLCLRLMSGGTLSDRLDRREPPPLADVARWIENLGDALAYAHRRNVVHGDVKPAAIVFDDDADSANPYFTDFAIGQPREGDTSPGVIGTPAYMAPEQWEGEPSTPATDQFGLAALAYYMLTGVRPFEGQDNPEIRRRNFEHGPLPADREAARHSREGVRAGVSRVLARGLAMNPGERYADVRDFSQNLQRALIGHPDPNDDPNAKPRAFLSYRRAGGAGLPLLIVNNLDKLGVDVFLDVQRIDGAVKFPERLTREMQKSDVFICLLGPGTLDSPWVRHEIHLACKQQKPMIPVFHEDYVLPDSSGNADVDELLSFDGIRLMDQQNLYVEEGIERLAKRIKETHARQQRR